MTLESKVILLLRVAALFLSEDWEYLSMEQNILRNKIKYKSQKIALIYSGPSNNSFHYIKHLIL